MWCAADNHNNACHTCAKSILDLNFIQAAINKISNFYEIASNFTYSLPNQLSKKIVLNYLLKVPY